MASPVGDEQPPAYESLIFGDRDVPSYIDMSGPNNLSITDTGAYYTMPTPPAPPTSVERHVTPSLPVSPTSIRNSSLYDIVENKTIYSDANVNNLRVDRNPSQARPQAPRKQGLYVKVLVAVVLVFLLGVTTAVTVALVVLRSDSAEKSSPQDSETSTAITTIMNTAETCDVRTDSDVEMAEPVYDTDGGYSIYGCTACPSKRFSSRTGNPVRTRIFLSCKTEVHMITMYEPEGSIRGFQENPSVIPDVEVDILSRSNHLPLSLVFSSYEATNWIVKFPEGVTINNVFLLSYYQSYSSVRVENSRGTVLDNYKLHTPNTGPTYMDYRGTGPSSAHSFGYGCSSCKGVDYVTSTMTSQYGCFTSFSGRYVAKSWTLDLDKNNC